MEDKDTITIHGYFNRMEFKKVRTPGKSGTRLTVTAIKYAGSKIEERTSVEMDNDQRELLKLFLDEN